MAAALGVGLGSAPDGNAQGKADVKDLARNNTEFAVDLYARLAQAEGNLFFSPYSISNALAMTYAGARGNTAEEMKTTLRFALGQDRLHGAFADLIRQLQGQDKKRKYQLTVANRLFGQKDYGFLPEFLKIGKQQYGAGLEEVDFAGATEQARQTINAWVEKQTKDKIKELLKPGILTSDSRLVLTNAIYFKAAWMRQFEAKDTKQEDFQLGADKKIKVPMMHGNFRTNFFDGGTFTALELPYENNDLSMVILLPKKVDGLPALEKELTAANLEKWLGKLSDHMVKISLPKFKLTAEFMLNKTLAEMGVRDAFTAKANFSGMTTREALYISAVVHKAFIDVNEIGTEAAAATAVVMERLSLPQPATFTADHPFLYLIRDNRNGTVLFMGRVVNPG